MSDTPENVVSSIPPLELGGGPPSDDTLPGMQLGDYVIEKAVAWGGMGIVYRAVHPLIGRKVAVKVLRPNFASDPEQMSRFLKEAQAISAIKHRGIIDIIGFGKIPMPDGRQYMVMEFLDGEPLEAVMQREGAMSAHRALTILEEVLDALSAAHKAGVVHRDLKPSNVYITLQSNGSRYVKLVDFGLARRASIADLNRHSGKASLMAGTPEYLSPEQAKGLAATPRTDLYCLGVMLFEMITGRLPFIEESLIELLNAHITKPPPRASSLANGVPKPLDDLIAQLLLKQPEARPNTAEGVRLQVQRMLRQLQEDETRIGARPGAPPSNADETQISVRPSAPPARGVAGPAAANEATLRVSRDEVRRQATEQGRKPPVPETLEMPQVVARGAVPSTRPDLRPRLSRWVWVAVGAGVAAFAGSVIVFRSPVEPVDPVTSEPPAPTVIAAPAPPPEPAIAELPPRQPAVAAAKVTVALKPKPKPVAPAKVEVPTACEEDWRPQMMGVIDGAVSAYVTKVGVHVNLERKAELEGFRARGLAAKGTSDCVAVVNDLISWRKKQGL